MGQCWSEKGECPICIQPIYSNLYNAPCCNCAFHKHCYMKWYNNNHSCPWCRFQEPKLSNAQILIYIQELAAELAAERTQAEERTHAEERTQAEERTHAEERGLALPSDFALDTQH